MKEMKLLKGVTSFKAHIKNSRLNLFYDSNSFELRRYLWLLNYLTSFIRSAVDLTNGILKLILFGCL